MTYYQHRSLSGGFGDTGSAGDLGDLRLVKALAREDIERGQVLAKPGSITPHTKFEAEVYCLSKDEGGRHTPFFSGYRPQFYFRTTDVTGTVTLPSGTEMVMPGDNLKFNVELIAPIEALSAKLAAGVETIEGTLRIREFVVGVEGGGYVVEDDHRPVFHHGAVARSGGDEDGHASPDGVALAVQFHVAFALQDVIDFRQGLVVMQTGFGREHLT